MHKRRNGAQEKLYTYYTMFRFLFARGPQCSYTKIAQLNASMSSIYTLAISHDGQFLASGGECNAKSNHQILTSG